MNAPRRARLHGCPDSSQAMFEATMRKDVTTAWRAALDEYSFHLDISGPPEMGLSRRERAERIDLLQALIAASRALAQRADLVDVDAAPAVRVAVEVEFALCNASAGPLSPESDPEWWNQEAITRARVVADLVDIRATHARQPEGAAADLALQLRQKDQLRVGDSAFARGALALLARTNQETPGTWRELSAFRGCGGANWDESLPAKERGKGYDRARRELARMVGCGLIERAGPGKTQRGGFRIANEGLSTLKMLDTPPAPR